MNPTKKTQCPNCGSKDVVARGNRHNQTQYLCKNCERTGATTKYFTSDTEEQKLVEKTVEDRTSKEISMITPERIRNEKELISQCEIDTTEWEIERWVCNKWEVAAKVGIDNPHIEVTPLFQVKVWLKKRTAEIESRNVIRDMISDAKKYAPIYPKIKYPKHEKGMVYEIGMPDLHFGKLAWGEESGKDYDIRIAEKLAIHAIGELLGFVRGIGIGRILLPLGNDYFNSNSAGETTVAGTKQIEDTRWQKTFVKGRKLLTAIIETCSLIAPVDILIIPGNHDRERMFYLGDALECWFHHNPNVTVDNRAMVRKYYTFGENLIGFTHGSDEKFGALPSIMAYEKPKEWGKSKNREWHLGDRHHKEDLIHRSKEDKGVMIRLLRSLTPADEWHYRMGFIGAQRAAESFLWHPNRGVIAQFTSVAQ